MQFWLKIRNFIPNINQNRRLLNFFNEKYQMFWWNFWFYACDQKLLLVTFYVKSYLEDRKLVLCWLLLWYPEESPLLAVPEGGLPPLGVMGCTWWDERWPWCWRWWWWLRWYECKLNNPPCNGNSLSIIVITDWLIWIFRKDSLKVSSKFYYFYA